MKISNIEKEIKKYLRTEYRKDVEFRALLALTELGDIVKYITHDKKLNPESRPHGTKNDEILAYGQALVQTIATMILRGINTEEAIKLGLKNWEEKDWQNQSKKKKKIISGISTFPGNVKGRAYVLSANNPIKKMPEKSILIAPIIRPDMIRYLTGVLALVADHGGMTSHGAIISRELRIPCIIGAGNATQMIPHGRNIKIITKRGKGFVELA